MGNTATYCGYCRHPGIDENVYPDVQPKMQSSSSKGSTRQVEKYIACLTNAIMYTVSITHIKCHGILKFTFLLFILLGLGHHPLKLDPCSNFVLHTDL